MHRGSSKATEEPIPDAEPLPLSAPRTCTVEFEVVRAGQARYRSVRVAPGTPLRLALREIGEFAEGSAVFDEGRSLPLDTPLDRDRRLKLVPTFSGG